VVMNAIPPSQPAAVESPYSMIIDKIYYIYLINFLFPIPIFFLKAQEVYQALLSHDTTLAATTAASVDQPRPNK